MSSTGVWEEARSVCSCEFALAMVICDSSWSHWTVCPVLLVVSHMAGSVLCLFRGEHSGREAQFKGHSVKDRENKRKRRLQC